jgi:hypothetical protein
MIDDHVLRRKAVDSACYLSPDLHKLIKRECLRLKVREQSLVSAIQHNNASRRRSEASLPTGKRRKVPLTAMIAIYSESITLLRA